MKRLYILAIPAAILLTAVLLNWERLTYYALSKAAQFYGSRAQIVIAMETLRGSPFSETTLENISISPSPELPQAYRFKAQTITCQYNLWDLRKSVESFLQGLSCTAVNPAFFQDTTVSMPEEEAGSEYESFLLPATLPGLDVLNGTVIIAAAGWDAEARDVNGRLRSIGRDHELQLEVGHLKVAAGDVTKLETDVSSRIRYSDSKLSVEFLELGRQAVSATGFVALAEVGRGPVRFKADIVSAESSVTIEGALEQDRLSTQVSTENFDIGELQRRLGIIEDVAGTIKGKAELAYNLKSGDFEGGSFEIEGRDGRFRGGVIDDFALAGSLDKKMLTVSRAEAGTPGNTVQISGLAVPAHLLWKGDVLGIIAGITAEFVMEITDAGSLLKLLRADPGAFSASAGTAVLTLAGHLDNGVVYLDDGVAAAGQSRLTLERGVIPVPSAPGAMKMVPLDFAARFESGSLADMAGLFGDIPLRGNATADLRMTGTAWEPQVAVNFAAENLGYSQWELGTVTLQGDVSINQETPGKLQAVKFVVAELRQANRTGMISLAAPASGSWHKGGFFMKAAFKTDGEAEIGVEITGEAGEETALNIITRNLQSRGWLGSFIDERYFFQGAAVDAFISGLPHNPQLKINGTIEQAGAADVPFPLSGSFSLHYTSRGIEISEFSWQSRGRNQLSMKGFLPYDPLAEEPFLEDDLSLAGHIGFASLEDVAVFLEPWGIATGSVSLDMELAGAWDRPEGHLLLQAENLEPPKNIRKFIESPLDVSVDIATREGSIELRSGRLESAQYSAKASGSWQGGLSSLKELLQKSGKPLRGELAADATVQLKDLNFLRKELPWLRRLEGDMQGELHLAGPVSRPAVTGSFSLKNGEASHTLNLPMLSSLNLLGEFDENSITVEKMQAEVGGAPVSLNGRVDRRDGSATVKLHIEGSNVLLFRNNDMRLRGDILLDVTGPMDHLTVRGSTALTGGAYTRNFEFLGILGSSAKPASGDTGFLFSFTEPPLKDAVFDVRVTTIEPFLIRNNFIRGSLRPDLTLKGTGELPFLLGTVYVDPTRVLLPSGRLQVQSGLLRFLEGQPDRPQLDLVAQSKLLGYDINVVTRGPIDDPVITLSSSPALSNDELLLLLLTGQPPKDDLAGGAENRGATNVMVYLGRDFLSKWLEGESGASDETIVDRFELDFGRNITRTGEQTVEAVFRLSEYSGSKGKMYYLSAEKDKYDAYNYGLKLVFRFE